MYEVEYNDGSLEALSANIIAKNILSQVDENGHRQMMMKEIIANMSLLTRRKVSPKTTTLVHKNVSHN